MLTGFSKEAPKEAWDVVRNLADDVIAAYDSGQLEAAREGLMHMDRFCSAWPQLVDETRYLSLFK